MVQRASSDAPSVTGGHRESRMGLGIGYAAYQSGYNKLFTQVCWCISYESPFIFLIYIFVYSFIIYANKKDYKK